MGSGEADSFSLPRQLCDSTRQRTREMPRPDGEKVGGDDVRFQLRCVRQPHAFDAGAGVTDSQSDMQHTHPRNPIDTRRSRTPSVECSLLRSGPPFGRWGFCTCRARGNESKREGAKTKTEIHSISTRCHRCTPGKIWHVVALGRSPQTIWPHFSSRPIRNMHCTPPSGPLPHPSSLTSRPAKCPISTPVGRKPLARLASHNPRHTLRMGRDKRALQPAQPARRARSNTARKQASNHFVGR